MLLELLERLLALRRLQDTGVPEHLKGSDYDQPLHRVVFDHEDGRLFHAK